MKDLAVVKYGSASVADEAGMDTRRLRAYAEQLACIAEDYDLILISSGAVLSGRAIWNELYRQATDNNQILAMLGSAEVVKAWQAAFKPRKILAGQLLVTHREIDEPNNEQSSLRTALINNLKHNVVTIVNENDALSEVELAELTYGGDNDGLALHIARVVDAKVLCLLTNTDGLLDENGETIRSVQFDPKSHQLARSLAGPANHHGRGGMRKKVEAAIEAAAHGIETYIGQAGVDLKSVLNDEQGTHFVAAR